MRKIVAFYVKWARRLLAYTLLVLVLIALYLSPLLIDFLEIIAKLQFGQIIGALFSIGPLYAVFLFILYGLLTMVFGRFFCSFMCPLGALMDLVGILRQKARRKKFAYKPRRFTQVLVPILVLLLFWVGISLPFGLLEPYSILSSKILSYLGGPSLVFFIVLVLSYFWGRGFCNSLCPTGFVLSLFAKGSIYRLAIGDTCIKCGACERVCPASCINFKEKLVDYGRCVLCLECKSLCPNSSLQYRRVLEPSEEGKLVRRSFIRKASIGALVGGALVTPEALRGGFLARPRPNPILPPGALSIAHLNAHCSSCHSCVRICPNHALKVSYLSSPLFLGKPVVDPYLGFCQYDCVECTRICPTGALINLDVEQKHIFRLGVVHFKREECIVITQGTSCGACAEICPTGAVTMGPGPLGRDEPIISWHHCIGCGACQAVCPVRPVSPIWVRGLAYQDMAAAKPIVAETPDQVLTEEFPF
ncbi:MAG: 4Fe-4S dicluster domain-containing protein [Deltaproteobacteria bacterium]|jgi:polyferredoxin|nr:4Fe-4S dicluster domain-containing protein [Deltaproteobacteria bacterium]